MPTIQDYDPRRLGFDQTIEEVMPTTREKEKAREAYRAGLVQRYEKRKQETKKKK